MRSGLDSRREFQDGVGSVTEQHGSVRSCKSGFDSRPARHGLLCDQISAMRLRETSADEACTVTFESSLQGCHAGSNAVSPQGHSMNIYVDEAGLFVPPRTGHRYSLVLALII